MYLNDTETVHDAISSWTENVNTANFTVCAMQSGRNTKNFSPFATVDLLAYQGAPQKAMTGEIKIQKWWSGTNCADVTFPKVSVRFFIIRSVIEVKCQQDMLQTKSNLKFDQ